MICECTGSTKSKTHSSYAPVILCLTFSLVESFEVAIFIFFIRIDYCAVVFYLSQKFAR